MRRLLLCLALTACGNITAPSPHHWETRYYWSSHQFVVAQVYFYCTTHQHQALTQPEITEAFIATHEQ